MGQRLVLFLFPFLPLLLLLIMSPLILPLKMLFLTSSTINITPQKIQSRLRHLIFILLRLPLQILLLFLLSLWPVPFNNIFPYLLGYNYFIKDLPAEENLQEHNESSWRGWLDL